MANGKKSGWLKWTILVLGLGGVAGGVWYFRSKGESAPEYQTAKVTRGDLTQAVTATGQLNPVLNVQVGSQISGIILKLNADFNTQVKAGQIVAQLDAATYQANVSSAEGDLANANAGLELAQVNARRAEELFKNKLIAQSEHDQSIATLHQAEAQVKIRTASVERARVDLARCTIYSPVDGIVISRNVDVGQTVAASMSAPTLFVIANDLAKMQIDANVSEADVGGVEINQDADFTVDAFPYRTFHGKVIQVRNAPTTVQNVVTYDVVIEVANPDLKLKPGMTANVSIVVARRENVLKIPNAALRFRPPEKVTGEKRTNAPPPLVAQATPPGGGGASGGGDGERRRGRGGPGGAGGGNRTGKPPGERQPLRTIHTLIHSEAGAASGAAPELKPVQVKLGINDGVMTEVLEGLAEGDQIVLSVTTPNAAVPASSQSNPFGSGFQRR
ncbi:MAG: efflux RND transporter periplasmic adaptor subunit [Pedosphaera sp.]|nr:efflux RND transporter periplasmic adaptor subunit [Pedosphaera sp.]